ncbi:MAG: peptide deformylase [bacterium]
MSLNRREWLVGCGAGTLTLLPGCGLRATGPTALQPPERSLVWRHATPLPIVQYRLGAPNPGTVLRRRALPARELSFGDLARIDKLMRQTLKRSGGVGLAAPQVGLPRRVVLVELQTGQRPAQPRPVKDRPAQPRPVLTCVDPRILRRSPRRVDGYEACLSIRDVGGLVSRAAWVELEYYDLAGRRRRRRSEGWEARIFQHELDHLDGRLYVDLVSGALLPIDEMRRLRRLRRLRKRSAVDRETVIARRPFPGELIL